MNPQFNFELARSRSADLERNAARRRPARAPRPRRDVRIRWSRRAAAPKPAACVGC